MSHVWCIVCHGNEHVTGHGIAFGGYGAYTVCDCGILLEHVGYTDEDERVPVRQRIPMGLDFPGGNDES